MFSVSKITTILHLSNLYLPSEIRADGIQVDLKVAMILTCLLFPIGMIYSPCIFLHLCAIFRASVFCGVPRQTKLTVYVEYVIGYWLYDLWGCNTGCCVLVSYGDEFQVCTGVLKDK